MQLTIKWQQFVIAPDAALVDWIVQSAARAPAPLHRRRMRDLAPQAHFQKASASGAAVDWIGDRKTRATLLLEAGQLG
jgi:hypothetical protein